MYSTNAKVIEQAIEVAEDAGVALSINLTGGVFVNQSAAFSDYHGTGANPARSGTPGGGSGGAIYQDGNAFGLSVCGTTVQSNRAKEGGSTPGQTVFGGAASTATRSPRSRSSPSACW